MPLLQAQASSVYTDRASFQGLTDWVRPSDWASFLGLQTKLVF